MWSDTGGIVEPNPATASGQELDRELEGSTATCKKPTLTPNSRHSKIGQRPRTYGTFLEDGRVPCHMKRVLFYFAIWATFLTRAQCTRSAPLYAIGDLGIVGDASVAGASLNNAGQIAITLNHQTGTANETLANKILLYSGGQLLELETLGGIGNGISDINDHGVMVGASDSPDGRYHAVVYTSGQLQDWGDSGELGSVASDINESGTVVGDIRNKQTSQAVIFNGPNDVTHLGTLGGTVSSVSAINNLGQIVGISLTGAPFVPGATDTPAQEAFLYENGHLIGFGTLGGHTSNGYGIN